MALRLQMKLGVVPEADRLADSPDTIVVVEPTVGARTRSKGQLFLLVTCAVAGLRARDATRLVAETIRSEYYYDESAGIRVCLIKAIHAANKRLAHARERAALGTGEPGPIGVAMAVVRDHELYVATVGPAEAYLSRNARLSTLPDPHRERGLPCDDLEPDVWRGEISVGDQLVLASPNLVAKLGPDELKDALVTLHPQSAMEHLHHRFAAADGSGSDGAIALEATEVAASRSGRAPVPVRPPEPLAGTPDRSPIPLADSVSGGVAVVQGGARRARSALGGGLGRVLVRAQELLPVRRPSPRHVTPIGIRRETQRRAAVALLVLIAVVGGLGLGVFVLARHQPTGEVISSVQAGDAALAAAKADLDRVSGPGVDLVANDPRKAEQLLRDALKQLDAAGAAGIPAPTLAPIRTRVVASLDRLYGMLEVSPTDLFAFPADPAVDLTALVKGPDGAPYALDGATQSVWRIDLAAKAAVSIYRAGTNVAGATEDAPRFLAVGGRDLLILDAKNVLWRWRAADRSGKGTTTRVKVKGSAEWGSDIKAIGTFVRNLDANLYNLYVVDPTVKQILAYAPAADGSGFPADPSNRLPVDRSADGITDLVIDGDIWIADSGSLVRIVGGKTEGWDATAPADTLLRAAPVYRRIATGSARRQGRIYGWDPANKRVVALLKTNGHYVEEYRLPAGVLDWTDIRGWYVITGLADEPDTLVWITATALRQAILEPATSGALPGGSPSPGTPGPTPTQVPTTIGGSPVPAASVP